MAGSRFSCGESDCCSCFGNYLLVSSRADCLARMAGNTRFFCGIPDSSHKICTQEAGGVYSYCVGAFGSRFFSSAYWVGGDYFGGLGSIKCV